MTLGANCYTKYSYCYTSGTINNPNNGDVRFVNISYLFTILVLTNCVELLNGIQLIKNMADKHPSKQTKYSSSWAS